MPIFTIAGYVHVEHVTESAIKSLPQTASLRVVKSCEPVNDVARGKDFFDESRKKGSAAIAS